MEYISSFTFCENIQNKATPQGTKQNIVDPLQILTPVNIPGNYSFYISCGIAGIDPENKNHLKIQFITPSGEMSHDTGNVNIQIPKERADSNGMGNIRFNMEMRNFILREEGMHTAKVLFNDNELGEYKINVIKLPK